MSSAAKRAVMNDATDSPLNDVIRTWNARGRPYVNAPIDHANQDRSEGGRTEVAQARASGIRNAPGCHRLTFQFIARSVATDRSST